MADTRLAATRHLETAPLAYIQETRRSRRAPVMTGDNAEAPADHMKLENQLCFALYAASRAMTNAYRPILS